MQVTGDFDGRDVCSTPNQRHLQACIHYDYIKEDREKADFGTGVFVQMSLPGLSAQYERNGL